MAGILQWVRKRRRSGGRLIARSDAFPRIASRETEIECVATGFRFTEGPVWLAEEGSLLFSDIPADTIFRLTPEGRISALRHPSGLSNGLTRDKTGRLIACEHGNRRVSRTDEGGRTTILADRFNGRKLNSPNDVVVKSDGSVYFTDPPYGIRSPDQQEQPVQGVYMLSPDERELRLVVDDFERPNGLAFSPDESNLYIDDSSDRRHIRVFDVRADGSLSGGRLFCDMKVGKPGVPDGLKVDVEGHVYCTGPGGVWVLDAEGRHLGTIITPEQPTNCAWGDGDRQSLYVTARSSIYRVRLNIPGIRVP